MRHPLSDEAFLGWMEKQGRRTYSWSDPHKCAVCQYFDSFGFDYEAVNMTHWFDRADRCHRLPENWSKAVFSKPGTRTTFAQAAKRLRHFMEDA